MIPFAEYTQMFYMFYNYSNLFPKIKCMYKKTLYTFVFLSNYTQKCPTFVVYINKTPHTACIQTKNSRFFTKQEFIFTQYFPLRGG